MVRSLVEYLANNPQLLTLFTGIFLGLCYYLGDLIHTNNWQYNDLTKQKYFFVGFGFITDYIVVPAAILYIIYALKNNSLNPSTMVYFGSLMVLNSMIRKDILRIGGEIVKFNKNKIKAHPVLLFCYIIFAVIFTLLMGTSDIILLIGTLILNLSIVTKVAVLSSLHYQSIIAEIKFIGSSEPKKYRLIEFIEKGTFIKVQDTNQDYEHVTTYTIPTSRIEYIKSQESITEYIKSQDTQTDSEQNKTK